METTPQQAPANPQGPTPAVFCKCPIVNESDWDKKKKILNKSFYKTFSPRLLYIPFSYAIDVDRAKKLAMMRGYQIPENPMILSVDGMFWGSIMVEVSAVKPEDKNLLTLNQEVYTKVSKRDWKLLKLDIAELNQELGQAPKEVYSWYTSCPKCKDNKVVKTVLIAIPQPPSQPTTPQPPVTPPPQQPSSPPTPST